MTLPRERADYSAIVDRPKQRLPNTGESEALSSWTVIGNLG